MEWQYRVIPFNVTGGHIRDEELNDLLNEWGKDGWELLTVTQVIAESQTTCLVHHLRKAPEPKRCAGFNV